MIFRERARVGIFARLKLILAETKRELMKHRPTRMHHNDRFSPGPGLFRLVFSVFFNFISFG